MSDAGDIGIWGSHDAACGSRPAAHAGGDSAGGGDEAARRPAYLRISLTDRCNFRCAYCMPAEGVVKLRHEDVLTFEELLVVIAPLVQELGVTKVRVTGGEPLARRGAVDFLRALGGIPGIADLSLTTNGSLLAPVAGAIRAAGVRRINISLDTLDRERFRALTRVDGLEQVLAGIAAARQAGFAPIKLNVVSLRETLAEASELVRFALARDLEIRFIELMPAHGAHAGAFVPNEDIRRALEGEFQFAPAEQAGRSPSASAELFRVTDRAGRRGVCGFISPVTHPFCARCNRIRLRGDGKLLPCLALPTSYDLVPYLRPRLRAAELAAHLRALLSNCKREMPARRAIRGMSAIGG